MIRGVTVDPVGGFMNRFNHFCIPHQIGNAELHLSGLPGAKKFTRATDFHILFGNDKAIVTFAQNAESLTGGLSERGLVEQHAVGFPGAAPDPAA